MFRLSRIDNGAIQLIGFPTLLPFRFDLLRIISFCHISSPLLARDASIIQIYQVSEIKEVRVLKPDLW
jgi:hypothetical protein